MTLTIYGVARSRAARLFWAAFELGLSFEHVPVIQARRLADPAAPGAPFNTRSPEFLAINPAGQIPAVELDGEILTESLAVPYILARRTGGPLAPIDTGEEARMLNWILWAATQIEPHAVVVILHGVDLPEDQRDAGLYAAAVGSLQPRFSELNTALARAGGWLVGGRFTIADLIVAEALRYAQPEPSLFVAVPAVVDWIQRCQSRPAHLRMQAMRAAEPA